MPKRPDIGSPQTRAEACCGAESSLPKRYRPVRTASVLRNPAGKVRVVPCSLSAGERLSAFLIRSGFSREAAAIDPGLYAVGSPDRKSPVLVSANYVLSFDSLRRELEGLSAWILVVDTKGVNVWCSASKGTFSANEISRMVKKTKLENIVTRKILVLPQLSGPGVAARRLPDLCGFRAVFGPVEARDIPAFLSGGMRATPESRLVRFGLKARMTVAWLELVRALGIWSAVSSLLVLGGLFFNEMSLAASLTALLPLIIAGLAGALAGGAGVPALLPSLPGRYFGLKGAFLGTVLGLAVFLPFVAGFGLPLYKALGLVGVCASVSAFAALSFSGSTTFTSLSGVKKEIRIVLGPCLAVCAAGLVLAFL